MSEERLRSILEALKTGEIKDNVSSVELLKTVKLYSENPEYEKYFIANKKALISFCTNNYNLEDCLSLMYLRNMPAFREEIRELFQVTINIIFSKETLMFLMKLYKEVKTGRKDIDFLYESIIEELKMMDSAKSTIILFDLFIFINFREKLNKDYPIITTMIKSYVDFNPNVVGSHVFAGSTIIGCLLKGHNEDLIKPYVEKLLQGQELTSKNMKMIGGGGSSLVYKINDLVLKLGETRNNRSVFVNHRILQSYVRDLLSRNDQDLFYVEVMKYVMTGDVTEEERDELKADLLRQGIVWGDDKTINCGVLPEGYTNDLYYNGVNPPMLATVIDNPRDREEFALRRRRVVVIDNDHMKIDATKLGK